VKNRYKYGLAWVIESHHGGGRWLAFPLGPYETRKQAREAMAEQYLENLDVDPDPEFRIRRYARVKP